MFQHVLQCCFYLLVSPLQNVIKGKGRCKTKPKRDEPKLGHMETQGNHKETTRKRTQHFEMMRHGTDGDSDTNTQKVMRNVGAQGEHS